MLLRLVFLSTSKRRLLLEDPEVSLPSVRNSRSPMTTDLKPSMKRSSLKLFMTSVWVSTSNKFMLLGVSSIEMALVKSLMMSSSEPSLVR
jgi:hypothetical protein